MEDNRQDMTRVNRIRNHPLYRESLHNIEKLEQERIFCGHNAQHLLDTARLAYIENLELNLGISKEMIYAAALLHDIGRGLQYTEGIPHHEGGVKLAAPILKDCGFTDAESEEILEAIGGHRDTSAKGKGTWQASFTGLIKVPAAAFPALPRRSAAGVQRRKICI